MRRSMVLAASLAVLLALSTANLARAQSSIASGVKIENKKHTESCTAGPMAIPKGADKNKTYLLTAGHCIVHGGGVKEIWMAGGKVIGPAEKVLFGPGKTGEFAAILIASEHETFHITNAQGQPEAVKGEWQTGDPNYPVQARIEKGGVSWPVAGETASGTNLKSCHVGATSGYQCGQVIGTGATYPETGTLPTGVPGLVEDTALGEPGDSGGPWFVEAANPPLSILGLHIAGDDQTLELKGSIANGANAITGITPGWVLTGIENRLNAKPRLEGTVTTPGIEFVATVVNVNRLTEEVELSNTAPAAQENVEFTFTYPPVTYYEPIGTILNEWDLELLTTKNEKRKGPKPLLLLESDGFELTPGSGLWIRSQLTLKTNTGNLECTGNILEGGLETNEGKSDNASLKEGSCSGGEFGDFPWPIEFKKNGEAAIKGTSEMLVTAGECQFASKKVKGAFIPGKAGEPVPLEVTISEQKFKLKSKSKENTAKCGKEAKLSGTLSFTSEGETVEDEVT